MKKTTFKNGQAPYLSDTVLNEMQDNIGGTKVLSTTQCLIGGAVTLNETIKNFRFVLLKPINMVTYIICPVMSDTSAVRGTNTYTAEDSVEIASARATCASTNFQLDIITGMTVKTTGVTKNAQYTGIDKIVGVR